MTKSSQKSPISLRIDHDVLSWFRTFQPRGYQTAMNVVLREYVREREARALRCAGRAQELFRRFYARCFWHLERELKITPKNIDLVLSGLRQHGGREGFLLADELVREMSIGEQDAAN